MSLLTLETSGRRSGRSTRLALKLVIQAIENAGTVVFVLDHTGLVSESRRVMYMVSDMLSVLGIAHVKDHNACAIKVYPVKERKE